MSNLHGRRFSNVCFVVLFPLVSSVVCVHTAAAATPDNSATVTEVATATAAGTLPATESAPVAVSPELQGDLLMAHRSYAAAIDAYTRDTAPSPMVWNKMGVAYHHMFAFEKARKYYQRALSMHPDFPEALNNLAAVYHSQHNFGLAERFYKQSIKLAPDKAVTYCNLGTAYFADGKYKPGMEAYKRALSLNPNIFDSRQIQIVQETSTRRQLVAVNYYLARTYATEGKFSDALSYLRKAMEAGFRDRKQLMNDKEFAALRTTPEFHHLMVEENGGE